MQWYINSEKLYYTHKNPIKRNAIDRSLLYYHWSPCKNLCLKSLVIKLTYY